MGSEAMFVRTMRSAFVTGGRAKPSLPGQCWKRCRQFTTAPSRLIAVTDMRDQDFAALRINQNRLMHDIHTTSEWGKGERWGSGDTEIGMARLSLSDSDKQARDWFTNTTEALGCKVTVDAMGNQFAVRPGLHEGPPTAAGSHLDTQPAGGRYDGILGVCAGIEALRTLDDNHIETSYPTCVINWTNEEGARFPISMVSSGVWAGSIPLETAHGLKSVIPADDPATMKSELERIGYKGAVQASYEAFPLSAHFELHIEQGPILEKENRRIGIVQGVQAYKWFTVTVRGRESHTGATSFEHRADALLTASKMILASHRIAHRHRALASTGILTLRPGSTNTIPGLVKFSLDVRAPRDETVDAVEEECRSTFIQIIAGHDNEGMNSGCATSNHRCTVDWSTNSVSPATYFHENCIKSVLDAGSDLCGTGQVQGSDVGAWGKFMTSGAGHDSVYTNKRCPTSMIFVPCRDGVSHNPAEYSSPDACADGTNVLLGAVLRHDRLRAADDGSGLSR